MIYIKKIIVAVTLLIGIGYIANAQPQSLYFFKSVTQRNQLNPAFQPSCNVYVGIPGANSIFADGGNTALSINSFIQNRSGQMTFALDAANGFRPELLNSFKPGNLFFANANVGIINFGFRVKRDYYFTFDLNIKSNGVFSYPKELMMLPLTGNSPSRDNYNLNIPMKYFGFKQEAYIETAFGLSYKSSDELTVGVKLKMLNGLVNVSTNTDNGTLHAGMDQWYLSKPVKVYIGSIIPNLPKLDSTGKLIGFNTDDAIKNVNAGSVFKNMGAAIDFGIDYRPSEIWSISASIVDLGFIHWNKQTSYNMQTSQDSAYQGVYVTPSPSGRPVVAQANLDTMAKIITGNLIKLGGVQQDSYTTMLSWKAYAGVSCFVWPDVLSLGVLSKTELYYNRLYEQVTVSANFFPIRMISTMASYSIMNNGFSNMGLGLNLKLFPLNIYIVGDYFPTVYGANMIPYKARMVNVHVGVNLIFGCRKKIKDKPMIDSY